MLLAIPFGAIAVTVFILSCVLLAATIYFFGDSFTSLKQLKAKVEREKRLVTMPEVIQEEKNPLSIAALLSTKGLGKIRMAKPHTAAENALLTEIRRSILHQQQQLTMLLDKAETWTGTVAHTPDGSDKERKLYEKIEQLELLLEEKEEALQQGTQHNEVSDLMSARLEQAQIEFESLQQRLNGLERQAAAANELAMQLEDLKEEQKSLKKEMGRKIEKLHELSTENGRLYKQLCETEDKLQAANTHRHQLAKRVSLLEELNTDFQDVSDTNSKLKNELRRIGELESMLNMMTQERNQLLGNR